MLRYKNYHSGIDYGNELVIQGYVPRLGIYSNLTQAALGRSIIYLTLQLEIVGKYVWGLQIQTQIDEGLLIPVIENACGCEVRLMTYDTN